MLRIFTSSSACISCVQIFSRNLCDSVRCNNYDTSCPLCQVSSGARKHTIPLYVSIQQHVALK